MPFVELCGNHDSYSIVSIQQQTSRYERRFSSTAQLLLLIQNNTRGLETKQSERNEEGERVTISLLCTQQQLSCVYFGVMENVFSVLY